MDPFEVIKVPVVEVVLDSPGGVVEVTIDKGGPTGPSGTTDHTELSNIGTYTHEEIDGHIEQSVDPHGTKLIQSDLDAIKATIGVRTGPPGVISTSQVLDFTTFGCRAITATGTFDITVSSLGLGQRGSVHILSDDPAPTITWVGVDVWIGGEPTFIAGKLTVVTLFNDGIRIVGCSGTEPETE